MYGICLTYTDSDDQAQDILQDGFIKVFRNLAKFQYRFDGSLEVWIRKIMINTALEVYRRNKRKEEVLDDYKEYIPVHSNDVWQQIKLSELVEKVNSLPSKAAMVLKLYAIEGYKHHEIAELMGISEGTSKSQLNRARQLLEQAISNG